MTKLHESISPVHDAVRRRHSMLLVLTLIAVFNTVDRVALGLLVQDIKHDLQLSDTQIGMIGGIAFAFFYSIMGVPIGRWADRGNRVFIIVLTTALWGIAVALCGLASSFGSLMLFRILVGVGEAGCVAPALSLLADYFNRQERPRALAIYGMGPALGSLVGFFGAGWLAEQYGWRVTFGFLGMPSILLAVLAYFLLAEPRLDPGFVRRSAQVETPPFRDVFRTIWGNRAFKYLLIGFSIMCFFSNGIFLWLPSVLMRSHGLDVVEVGIALSLIWGGAGAAGAYAGGAVASGYATGNERLQFQALAIVIALTGVVSTLAYVVGNWMLALGFIGLSTFGLAAINGPILAAFQTLMPVRMRAVSVALVYLVVNLLGLGLGPLTAGVLSDALAPWAGNESLRYALMILSPGYVLGAWCLWRASGSILQDLVVEERGHSPIADQGNIQ